MAELIKSTQLTNKIMYNWKPHKEIEQLKALRESEGFSFKQLENQDIYEIILFTSISSNVNTKTNP